MELFTNLSFSVLFIQILVGLSKATILFIVASGLTLMLGIYSVFIAVREWSRRRMKNRVDAYLLKVESLVHNGDTLNHNDLQGQQSALMELRREAFSDLIAERLLADEAFTILQNHLRDELTAIELLINQKADTEN